MTNRVSLKEVRNMLIDMSDTRHEVGAALYRKEKEFQVKMQDGSCKNCKSRNELYCNYKKKILNTIHAYCGFWKRNENVI